MSTEQSVLNAQFNAAIEARSAECERARPFYLLRPTMRKDGDRWCALYGDNLTQGVVAFGATPEAAATNFDRVWRGLAPLK